MNVDFLHDLPRFEIISKLKDSTASLADIDTVINFPSQTNFKYYSRHEFHDSSEIKRPFHIILFQHYIATLKVYLQTLNYLLQCWQR